MCVFSSRFIWSGHPKKSIWWFSCVPKGPWVSEASCRRVLGTGQSLLWATNSVKAHDQLIVWQLLRIYLRLQSFRTALCRQYSERLNRVFYRDPTIIWIPAEKLFPKFQSPQLTSSKPGYWGSGIGTRGEIFYRIINKDDWRVSHCVKVRFWPFGIHDWKSLENWQLRRMSSKVALSNRYPITLTLVIRGYDIKCSKRGSKVSKPHRISHFQTLGLLIKGESAYPINASRSYLFEQKYVVD